MEKDLKRLEDECINNVEDAFNNFLLVDLTEAGEVEDLIGDLDWYLFWLSHASEINWRINYIIENGGDNKLLKRAVILKRVIDENIIKYASTDTVRKDLRLGGKIARDKIIPINVNEGRVELFLGLFHSVLLNEGLTDSSFHDFTTNFIEGDIHIPINWIGKQNALLGLVKFLNSKKVILQKNRTLTSLIVNNFTINGKSINQRSVEVGLSSVDDSQGKFSNFQKLVDFLQQ